MKTMVIRKRISFWAGLAGSLMIILNVVNMTSLFAATRTWTDIGSLGHSATARAVNDRGVVVGDSYLMPGHEYHAFIWRDGQMQDIGTPGQNSSARAVNTHGQVVGNHYADVLKYRPFLWQDGQMTDLTPILGYASLDDINDNGQIVGTLIEGDGRIPFVYDSVTGDVTRLADYGNANAINNNGHIVGSKAVSGFQMATLWADGQTRDLGVLPNFAGSVATDINSSGNVTGWVTDEYGWTQRGFYWHDGVMQEIGAKDYGWNVPMSINDQNQATGTHYQGDGEIAMPFVWAGGESEVLTTGDLPDNLQFGYGIDSNNAGQLVIQSAGHSYISQASRAVTIDDVIADIDQLRAAGKLPWIDSVVMQTLLGQAKNQIAGGNTPAACLRLPMVIGQIDRLERSGQLSYKSAHALRGDMRFIASTNCS